MNLLPAAAEDTADQPADDTTGTAEELEPYELFRRRRVERLVGRPQLKTDVAAPAALEKKSRSTAKPSRRDLEEMNKLLDGDIEVSPTDFVHQLEDGPVKELLAQVLFGDRCVLPGSFSNKDVRSALRILAGTKELEKPAVMMRYHALNGNLGVGSGDLEYRDHVNPAHRPTAAANAGVGFRSITLFRVPNAPCAATELDNLVRVKHIQQMFFPDVGDSSLPAKAMCLECPAIETCLQKALDNRKLEGVWGATSRPQRIRIYRHGLRYGPESTAKLIQKLRMQTQKRILDGSELDADDEQLIADINKKNR